MELIGWIFVFMVIGFLMTTMYSILNNVVLINNYDEDEVFEEE